MHSISKRVLQTLPVIKNSYYRLILIVGPPLTSKTQAIIELHENNSWPLINVNLQLSEKLINLTLKDRRIEVAQLLEETIKDYQSDIVLLDNIEILFSIELKQDPLRLLLKLSRKRTVVAIWTGDSTGTNLVYANSEHQEYRYYSKTDAVIISVV